MCRCRLIVKFEFLHVLIREYFNNIIPWTYFEVILIQILNFCFRIPTFGLPFNLPGLPMLQDSKKMLERNSNMILPGNRYENEERPSTREADRFPPAWPSRHTDFDHHDRDSSIENGRDRSLEKGNSEQYTILHKTLMQHKQNQQQREKDQPPHVLPHSLPFQIPQQQKQHSLPPLPPPSQQSSSQFPPQISPHYPSNCQSNPSSDGYDRLDVKDVKDIKAVKDLSDADRSHEDDKSSISPPQDKSQYSPPSDGTWKGRPIFIYFAFIYLAKFFCIS